MIKKLFKSYANKTPFLDVLFNTLLGFVLLFTMAFMMMNVEKQDANAKMKAEYLISITWQDKSADDVDVWMEDPLGNVLFFRNKEIPMAHLDRDDLGIVNDTVILPNGVREIYERNQEIVTIRGFIPGEWILNIHMYRKIDKEPAIVEVRMDKINPKFKTIFSKKYTMGTFWEEITVSRFTMSADGQIMSLDDLPKRLIKSTVVGIIN